MRRHMMIAAVAALQSLECAVSSNHTTVEIRFDDVATDPEVLPLLWQMLDDAGGGFKRTEEAAFIVRKADRRLVLVRWPEAGEPDTSRWAGPLPDGVVAIVHTHPNWERLPSTVDIRTSQRSRLPVYVVTRTEISKTLGGSPEIVLNGDWSGAISDRAAFHRTDASSDRTLGALR